MQRQWQAFLNLTFEPSGGKSVLTYERHEGPLRVQQLFYPEKTQGILPCHCLLLHPPGGLVNGDELAINIKACKGARVLITTPSASKFYRSTGPLQTQITKIKLQASELVHVPQESLYFDEARAVVRLEAQLDEESCLVTSDISCLGRHDLGEEFDKGSLDNATLIKIGDTPVLTERLRLDKKTFKRTSKLTLNSKPFYLSLSAVPKAKDRGILKEICTTLQDDLKQFDRSDALCAVSAKDEILNLRALGQSLATLKDIQTLALEELYPPFLGRPFLAPRIWRT